MPPDDSKLPAKRGETAVANKTSGPEWQPIPFTVDAALFRELGERLVGKAFVALGELVKNSYDADATHVVIRFLKNTIEVEDNGHGMSLNDFRDFWMRIGTPHKQRLKKTKLHRPLTGSKGVGRLSVQFLASRMRLQSVADKGIDQIEVQINWEEAVRAPELVEATAMCRTVASSLTFPSGKRHGTKLVLEGLRHKWSPEDFRDLAQQIWWLQPPFSEVSDFRVELESPETDVRRSFDSQMKAILDIWHARMRGKLIQGKTGKEVFLLFEFAGDRHPATITYPVSDDLNKLDFEIRVYNLKRRQPKGISVSDARDYMNRYGGVRIYDAAFHLPYYGQETDWLRVEIDHSHRLGSSDLLPENLQVSRGLNFLPTNSRLLGAVNVNTATERQVAQQRKSYCEPLTIAVTRDRLLENSSYSSLQTAVRWALDYYAMQEAKRALAEAEKHRPNETAETVLERVDSVLDQMAATIPDKERKALQSAVVAAIAATQAENEIHQQQASLLGSLATAGMTALAYEHEAAKQFATLEGLVEDIRDQANKNKQTQSALCNIADRLAAWISYARDTRKLFSNLLQPENRDLRLRLRAKAAIDDTIDHMSVLLRGVPVDTSGVETSLRLPKATQAEWSSLFQNVLINAVNAMIDSDRKRIRIRSSEHGEKRSIVVEDTGVGIDLDEADKYFEPFERELQISRERQALGLGGTGLGLTIVKMIAENAKCSVGFGTPSKGFSTSFRLTWTEKA